MNTVNNSPLLLPFTKMQGLGNDFVVLDFINHPMNLSNAQFAQIADRRFGIGCDQILIVETSDVAGIDFRYRIHNADGSEVGQCGNGARCFVEFVRAKGLTDKTTISVATCSGTMTLHSLGDHQVRVNMGKVSFAPDDVPFIAEQPQDLYELVIEDPSNGNETLPEILPEKLSIAVANIGNPHALILVDDVATAPVEHLGPLVESHARFPERVNVSFMQILSRQSVNLRVYERGSGETLACGSGACAAVAMGQALGHLDDTVIVNLPGGTLSITQDEEHAILMTGPANFVFEGVYELASNAQATVTEK